MNSRAAQDGASRVLTPPWLMHPQSRRLVLAALDQALEASFTGLAPLPPQDGRDQPVVERLWEDLDRLLDRLERDRPWAASLPCVCRPASARLGPLQKSESWSFSAASGAVPIRIAGDPMSMTASGPRAFHDGSRNVDAGKARLGE